MDTLDLGRSSSLLGLALVTFSLASAFRTVVLPRAAFDPLTRAIFLGFRSFLLWLSPGAATTSTERSCSASTHPWAC